MSILQSIAQSALHLHATLTGRQYQTLGNGHSQANGIETIFTEDPQMVTYSTNNSNGSPNAAESSPDDSFCISKGVIYMSLGFRETMNAETRSDDETGGSD
jgi:hypothetical protein